MIKALSAKHKITSVCTGFFSIYSVYQQLSLLFASVIALNKFLYIGWRNHSAIFRLRALAEFFSI